MSDNLSQTLQIKTDDRASGLTVADLVALAEAATAINTPPTAPLKARVGFKGQVLSLEVTRD